jgi:two-component system, NtrC family, sensor kinase
VLGQDLMEFIPESERMKLMRVVAQSLKGEAVESFETRILHKKKHEVRVAFATSAVLSQGGEIEGVIAIGQDLTRMRDLERRVIQAEKLASIGQLAASVVHEINNPMTAVVTYADALLQRARTHPPKDPGDAEKYKKIVDNSERVLRFTRDLVSYARPANDKPETVELNQVFEKAVDFCEHVLDKHDVQVERAFGQVPRMLAVKQNLVQVFVNLITNACHAVGKGGKIRLVTRAETNAIVAEVSDTGSGIEESVIEHIFEPFFTTKGEGKGTGLGLSIVQGIVENHGGTISVASEAGKGTTFTLRFPMVMIGS